MISLILTLAVVGMIVWAVVTYIPMPDGFRKVIIVVAIVCVAIYVLYAFGFSGAHDVPVPQVLH